MSEQAPDPAAETISSDEGFEPGRRLPALPTPSRGVRATALGTAVSLVLLGGVATATYRSAQGAADPTTLIPASAFAVAVADLGLPGGQDDALRTFADHFPGSPTHRGDGSALDRLLRALFRSDPSPIDYDADIKPWLGDHVAIAGWIDSDGDPRMEALLESTDDGSARQHLADLMTDDKGAAGSVEFHSGYAVISDSRRLTDAALAAAASKSLADSGRFAGDVDGLPDDQAVIGWLDGPALSRAIRAQLGGDMPPGALFGTPFGLPMGQTLLDERIAAGAHVSDDYVQVDLLEYGGTAAAASSSALLTGLPGDTVAGLELGDATKVSAGLTTMLRSFGGFGAASGATACFVTPAMPRMHARLAVPPGTPHRRAILRKLRRARHRAAQRLRESRSNQGSTDFGATCPPPRPRRTRSTPSRR